jgi:hypothetical protein
MTEGSTARAHDSLDVAVQGNMADASSRRARISLVTSSKIMVRVATTIFSPPSAGLGRLVIVRSIEQCAIGGLGDETVLIIVSTASTLLIQSFEYSLKYFWIMLIYLSS